MNLGGLGTSFLWVAASVAVAGAFEVRWDATLEGALDRRLARRVAAEARHGSWRALVEGAGGAPRWTVTGPGVGPLQQLTVGRLTPRWGRALPGLRAAGGSRPRPAVDGNLQSARAGVGARATYGGVDWVGFWSTETGADPVVGGALSWRPSGGPLGVHAFALHGGASTQRFGGGTLWWSEPALHYRFDYARTAQGGEHLAFAADVVEPHLRWRAEWLARTAAAPSLAEPGAGRRRLSLSAWPAWRWRTQLGVVGDRRAETVAATVRWWPLAPNAPLGRTTVEGRWGAEPGVALKWVSRRLRVGWARAAGGGRAAGVRLGFRYGPGSLEVEARAYAGSRGRRASELLGTALGLGRARFNAAGTAGAQFGARFSWRLGPLRSRLVYVERVRDGVQDGRRLAFELEGFVAR